MAATKKQSKTSKAASAPAGGAAQKIWLAGLGALATAEEEGSKVFDRLVSKGRDYRGDAGQAIDDATGRMRETVADVRGRAGETWKKVEQAFDRQVGTALGRLGVPARSEIAAVTRRIEELHRKLDTLLASGPVRKTPAKKKAAARQTKKKTSVRKKTSASAKKTVRKKATRKKRS